MRHVLEGEVDGHRLILPARRLADDGLTAWAEVLARGYEGLVAKDPASPYVGGRSLKWLKVKVPKYREGWRGWERSSDDLEPTGRYRTHHERREGLDARVCCPSCL